MPRKATDYSGILRNDLELMRWGDSASLPSLRELALDYGCSAVTIKRAVDVLVSEGRLISIHGKGIFRPGGKVLSRARRGKMIGAIMLGGVSTDALLELKEGYLASGWLLSVYDATADSQSPEREKAFLLRADQEGYAGVMLYATPTKPINTRLFARLRVGGMKVAHMSPYMDDMEKETYFVLDYGLAARRAVELAAKRGYRRVVYVAGLEGMPPFRRIQFDAVQTAAGAAGIGVDVLDAKDIAGISGTDDRVFLVSYDYLGEEILSCNGNSKVLSLLSTQSARVSGFDFDRRAQIREALSYLTDGKIDPGARQQRMFAPVFHDLGTF